MKNKLLVALSAAALTCSLAACDVEGSTCAPQAASHRIVLQNVEHPLPEAPGGGSGGSGSGGRGGSGGSSSGGSYGGSKGGSSGSYGGSKGGSSSGGSKTSGGSSSSGGGYTPRIPASKPDRGYRPSPGQPPVTYVQQPNGQWGGFLGGMLVGDMLNDPPAGCR